MSKVEIFHIGPQKTASTWLYYCFKEHPDISIASTDSIHYFDMNFHRSDNWYLSHFNPDEKGKKIDMTQSYIRSLTAPGLIAEYNPSAKLTLCIREPISRAFSHYWHNKKKSDFNFTFEQVFKNYDLFSSWVETGFYAQKIETYLQHFDRDSIHIQIYDELIQSPEEFLQKTFDFMGVDSSFKPSVLNKRINQAKPQKSKEEQKRQKILQKLRLHKPASNVQKALIKSGIIQKPEIEKLESVSPEIIDKLLEIYEPETKKLETLLDIDLSHWRSPLSIKTDE